MIIFLNQKVKFKFLLPKKFVYFTTNPELGEELSLQRKTVSLGIKHYKNRAYYDKVLNFQKTLLTNNLPEYFNPKSVHFDLNFEYTKKIYYDYLRSIVQKQFGEKVVFTNNFCYHKSIRLYTFFILQKIDVPLKELILLLPSLKNFIFFLIKPNKTLVLSNVNHFEQIKLTFGKSNYFHFSKNFRLNNTVNLDSLYFLYKTILFLPLYLKGLYAIKSFDNKNKINYNLSNILYNYSLYKFSKFISNCSRFSIIATSNYGYSEAFLNLNKDTLLINHGAHYVDDNELINFLWKFQSQTMICCKGPVVSTNYLDKVFLDQINHKNKFKLLEKTIRASIPRVKKTDSKVILIADTFKIDNTLRPYLYHEVNLYIEFIRIILKYSPKNHKVIIRHREDTILSKQFLRNRFPNLIFSRNAKISDDFIQDPILISYSSTTLMEAKSIGLRTVTLDLFKTNLNFLNSEKFMDVNHLPKRFNFSIQTKKDWIKFCDLLNKRI